MENKIRFGPAGNSQIFYDEGNVKSTQAPAWLKQKDLSAYEYSFGRGFTMSEETARELGNEAVKNNILVSAHAPYYVNLANTNDEMVQKSYGYVLRSLQYLEWFNGQKVVVHLASQGELNRQVALELTKEHLKTLIAMAKQNFDMTNKYICPETLGKYQQIGNEYEIVDLCTLDECLVPTFDFGHLNCLKQGGLSTVEEYKKIFDYAIEKLGYERVKNCHIHFSKIEYGAKGELRHLDFEDARFGPHFEQLAQVLKEYKLTPSVICESASHMAEDAMTMNKIYSDIK